jgi:hypothetical protein
MDLVELEPIVPATIAGVVVVHGGHPPQPADGHEAATRAALAREIATLKGYAFAGEFDAAFRYPGAVYHVPRDTILASEAAALGIRSASDLFGGVVPQAFIATKSIGHPLVSGDAVAPAGWSHAFADAVGDDVLDGFSAFSARDAIAAGVRLLANGAVRVKRSLGIGGAGQVVVGDRAALVDAVQAIAQDEIAHCGVVLERNLADVVTLSVGRVEVGASVITYHGTQRLACNNAGREVYGGSALVVARGDFDALGAIDAPQSVRDAIARARRYHAAVLEHYPGVIVSRSNYDVLCGTDASGRVRCGVLEQSWRLGGATGAELAALRAFARDPALRVVRATTVERYGPFEPLPAGATVHYRDTDPRVGPLT